MQWRRRIAQWRWRIVEMMWQRHRPPPMLARSAVQSAAENQPRRRQGGPARPGPARPRQGAPTPRKHRCTGCTGCDRRVASARRGRTRCGRRAAARRAACGAATRQQRLAAKAPGTPSRRAGRSTGRGSPTRTSSRLQPALLDDDDGGGRGDVHLQQVSPRRPHLRSFRWLRCCRCCCAAGLLAPHRRTEKHDVCRVSCESSANETPSPEAPSRVETRRDESSPVRSSPVQPSPVRAG